MNALVPPGLIPDIFAIPISDLVRRRLAPALRIRFAHPRTEIIMEIEWRRDIDKALDDAKNQQRPLLLDFSAAPM
jgi:hypothetical protein